MRESGADEADEGGLTPAEKRKARRAKRSAARRVEEEAALSRLAQAESPHSGGVLAGLSRKPLSLMSSGLAAMSSVARILAKEHTLREAKRLVAAAFEEGHWVAASDASVDLLGRAAIAWAVFGPDRRLAASGESIVTTDFHSSTTTVEAIAAMRACEELSRLGAPSALCVCDCVPAIQKLTGRGRGREQGLSAAAASWAEASKGRYQLGWVPREALGPANDAARALLSLRAEKGVERPWSAWVAQMSAPSDRIAAAHEPMPCAWSALSAGAQDAMRVARDEQWWVAVADASLSSDGRHVGIGLAIFNGAGILVEQASRLCRVETPFDIEDGLRQASLVAAKRLAHWKAPSGLCISGAPSFEAEPARRGKLDRWFGSAGRYVHEHAQRAAMGIAPAMARSQAAGVSMGMKFAPEWREAQWAGWMESMRTEGQFQASKSVQRPAAIAKQARREAKRSLAAAEAAAKSAS